MKDPGTQRKAKNRVARTRPNNERAGSGLQNLKTNIYILYRITQQLTKNQKSFICEKCGIKDLQNSLCLAGTL